MRRAAPQLLLMPNSPWGSEIQHINSLEGMGGGAGWDYLFASLSWPSRSTTTSSTCTAQHAGCEAWHNLRRGAMRAACCVLAARPLLLFLLGP